MRNRKYSVRELTDLGNIVGRDASLTPGAKERLQNFLGTVDRAMPGITAQTSAQIQLETLNAAVDALHAYVARVMPSAVPPRDEVDALVRTVTQTIDKALVSREEERDALLALGRYEDGRSTHDNVMAALDALREYAPRPTADELMDPETPEPVTAGGKRGKAR